MTMTTPTESTTRSFDSADAWERWLVENQADQGGVWLRIFKKQSGIPTVTYDEAVDVALCHGWIDGQKRACDDVSWLQRFVPRRPKSAWSKRNTERVERLTAEGRMRPAGLAEAEAARRDGRWDAAYHAQSTAAVPPDFQDALDANPAAAAFFETLAKSSRYAFLYRITTIKKPETRAARIAKFVDMLARGEKLHLI
jgi:uncharacterized protein YdeI (YjbR/CyaY-like superfamily)